MKPAPLALLRLPAADLRGWRVICTVPILGYVDAWSTTVDSKASRYERHSSMLPIALAVYTLICLFSLKGAIPCLLLPLLLPAKTTLVFSMN